MKKFLVVSVILVIIFSFSTLAFAAEMPTPPNIEGLSVEEANQLIDEYNAQIDAYNAAVDSEYETAQAEVDAHNAAEQEKVEANAVELEEYEKIQEKIEADAKKSLETVTTSTEDLPTDWELTEQDQTKTITVTDAEEKSGETYRVINIHGFYDDSSDTYNAASVEDETFKVNATEGLIRTEWETVEADKNDTVQVISVSKPMGYRSSAFYKRFEGYTNGYWMPSSQEFVIYSSDVNYDWVSGTSYSFSYQYDDIPYNVYSFYGYDFVRLGDEPTKVEKYIADFWEDIIKGKYGTKMDRLVPVEPTPAPGDDPVEPEPQPEPEPDPVIPEPIPTPVKPVIPEVVPEDVSPQVDEEPVPETVRPTRNSTPTSEPVVTETIEEPEVPLADTPTEILELSETPLSRPQKVLGKENIKLMLEDEWALVNLILMVLTILALIKFNRKVNWVNVVVAAVAAIIFVLTENTFSRMIMVDKYTILMVAIYVLEIVIRLFGKKDEKEDLD